MKTFIKKKTGPKKGPKFRTPKSFRGRVFAAKKQEFRVQHRG